MGDLLSEGFVEDTHKRALQEVTVAAGSLLDPSTLAKLTVNHLRELTQADGTALYWWDENEELLLPLAYLDPLGQNPHPVFHAGQGVTGAAFATGKAVIANDYLHDVAFPAAWAIGDEDIRAIAAVPLMVDGTPQGVLVLIQHHEEDLTKDQLNLMEIVGAQVAPALDGMRLLAHAKFCQAQAEELAALMRDGVSSTDLMALLRQISMVSCRLLGADFTGVAMPGDHQHSWQSVYGNRSEVWAKSTYEEHIGLFISTRSQGEPFVLTHADADPDDLLATTPLTVAEGLRMVLIIPLKGNDGVLVGGLMLGWRFKFAPTEKSLEMAGTLGGCATALLVKARTTALLYEREHMLQLQAFHDPLTGLANRRLFFEQLTQQIEVTPSHVDGECAMAVALLDVVGLRQLTARHGHMAGDGLVMQIGQRLQSTLEDSEGVGRDLVAQMTDDTFAVFLAACPNEPITKTLERRLLQAFNLPFLFEGQPLTIKARLGAALIPRNSMDAQDILRCADMALTVAHRTNQPLVMYNMEQQRADQRRQILAADLRRALPAGELTMDFQPIVDATDGRLLQAEALARWQHPEYGQIPPEMFIALAEESGLMPSLTEWALNTALTECRLWQRTKPGVGVAVNLSSSDLQSAAFPSLLADMLAEHNFPASLLCLEMTETTLMTDVDTTLEVLSRLSSTEVGFAIDDFGTGYSSLSYLRRLPVGIVKIDNSFVTKMLDDIEDTAIVAMIVALARTLGLSTVAEGVEEEGTGARLVEFGVDCLQGYGIARPMTASNLQAWIPVSVG